MNLSYLIPDDGTYDFFGQLVPYLEQQSDIELAVNAIGSGTDLVLAAILPCTQKWGETLLRTGVPTILWHWDQYSYTDQSEQRWQDFWTLSRTAVEMWCGSHETAREMKEFHGLDSTVMPAWVMEDDLAPATPQELSNVRPYAFYAATTHSIGKRVSWAQEACNLEGIELACPQGMKKSRTQYLKILRQARVYLMTACEESNGSIPAMEAAAAGVPLVISDLPASREVFGQYAPKLHWFRTTDFDSLRCVLADAWYGAQQLGDDRLRDRMLTLFGSKQVFPRIARRLREVHANLQAASGR